VQGKVVPKDETKAFNYYQQAAEAGQVN
jgi:TPR repeat protein